MLLVLFACLALVTGRSDWSPESNGWINVGEVEAHALVSLRLALSHKVGAVEKLTAFVSAVSNPDSASYANYMNLDELTAMMAPTDADLAGVEDYFTNECGCNWDLTLSKDFAVVGCPAKQITRCVGSAFHVFEHVVSGRRVIRAVEVAAWTWSPAVASTVQLVLGVSDFLDSAAERKGVASLKKGLRARASTSAPEIRRIRGGSDTVASALVLYCPDGTPVTTFSGSCGAVTVQAVDMTVLPVGYPASPYSFPFSSLTPENDGQTQWFYAPTVRIPKFARVNVTVVVTYSDGSTSQQGAYSTQYSSSPWLFACNVARGCK